MPLGLKYYSKFSWPILFSLLLAAGPAYPAHRPVDPFQNAVVKIYVTFQRQDFSLPWQGARPGSGTGSGFIIEGKRILTNAHVVSDVRFLQVQKENDTKRYAAHVQFIAHDCDLAILNVDDPAFFSDTRPLRFAKELPRLNDEVTVVGYPSGGDRLSLTRGVVSRIDYSTYAHSAVDQHLALQVDAAINPGNSGGPVLFNNRVVGLAFQGISWAENIGYAIPIPVIRRFLLDIEDGTYNGYPELGVAFLDMRNPALRHDLKLPASETGVVVYYLDPFGSAVGLLRPADVLLAIDGYDIGDDATVKLDDNRVLFAELLERKQYAEAIKLSVWRDGGKLDVVVPLAGPEDPFAYRYPYDRRTQYFISGGLVFSPLTRGYLGTVRRNAADPDVQQLFYYARYAKIDKLYEGRDEFVVLIHRLPHPVNAYADEFLNGIVDRINGKTIRNLADIRSAIEHPTNDFHIIEFFDLEDRLILDAKKTEEASPVILREYGVSSPAHIEEPQ